MLLQRCSQQHNSFCVEQQTVLLPVNVTHDFTSGGRFFGQGRDNPPGPATPCARYAPPKRLHQQPPASGIASMRELPFESCGLNWWPPLSNSAAPQNPGRNAGRTPSLAAPSHHVGISAHEGTRAMGVRRAQRHRTLRIVTHGICSRAAHGAPAMALRPPSLTSTSLPRRNNVVSAGSAAPASVSSPA